MKALPYFLALASFLLFVGTMFLWFIVPRWMMTSMNSGARMSAVEQFFIVLSNLARTPLGIFATLNIFGIIGLVLIWSLVWKRKT